MEFLIWNWGQAMWTKKTPLHQELHRLQFFGSACWPHHRCPMGCGDGSSSPSVCRNAALCFAAVYQLCFPRGAPAGAEAGPCGGAVARAPQRSSARAVCRGPVLRGTPGEAVGLLPHAQLAGAGLPRGSLLLLAHRGPEEPGKAAQLIFSAAGTEPQSRRLPRLPGTPDGTRRAQRAGQGQRARAQLRPPHLPLPHRPSASCASSAALVHPPQWNPSKHLWLLRLLSQRGFKHYFLN